ARRGTRHRALSGSLQAESIGWTGRLRGVLPDALSGSAGPGTRTTLRLVRGALRYRGKPRLDRNGIGSKNGIDFEGTIRRYNNPSAPYPPIEQFWCSWEHLNCSSSLFLRIFMAVK